MPVHTLSDSKRAGRSDCKEHYWHCAEKQYKSVLHPKVLQHRGPDNLPSSLDSGLKWWKSQVQATTSNECMSFLAACY
jgi:hypothetical protein